MRPQAVPHTVEPGLGRAPPRDQVSSDDPYLGPDRARVRGRLGVPELLGAALPPHHHCVLVTLQQGAIVTYQTLIIALTLTIAIILPLTSERRQSEGTYSP